MKVELDRGYGIRSETSWSDFAGLYRYEQDTPLAEVSWRYGNDASKEKFSGIVLDGNAVDSQNIEAVTISPAVVLDQVDIRKIQGNIAHVFAPHFGHVTSLSDFANASIAPWVVVKLMPSLSVSPTKHGNRPSRSKSWPQVSQCFL